MLVAQPAVTSAGQHRQGVQKLQRRKWDFGDGGHEYSACTCMALPNSTQVSKEYVCEQHMLRRCMAQHTCLWQPSCQLAAPQAPGMPWLLWT